MGEPLPLASGRKALWGHGEVSAHATKRQSARRQRADQVVWVFAGGGGPWSDCRGALGGMLLLGKVSEEWRGGEGRKELGLAQSLAGRNLGCGFPLAMAGLGAQVTSRGGRHTPHCGPRQRPLRFSTASSGSSPPLLMAEEERYALACTLGDPPIQGLGNGHRMWSEKPRIWVLASLQLRDLRSLPFILLQVSVSSSIKWS